MRTELIVIVTDSRVGEISIFSPIGVRLAKYANPASLSGAQGPMMYGVLR